MMDRTTFDLRIAEHNATVARVNTSEWQHGQPTRRPIRAALASILVTLAARLDPVQTAPLQSRAAGPLAAAPSAR
ncbi:MAG: hypothetical protein ACTHMJ_10115 [Thermomicrobiales bacterium]